MKPQLPHLERGYYESLIIILDTLERCLRQQANILHAHQKNAARGEEGTTAMVPACTRDTSATSKHEEVVNFKNLLKEICHFIGTDFYSFSAVCLPFIAVCLHSLAVCFPTATFCLHCAADCLTF